MRTNDQYTNALFSLLPQGRLMPKISDDSELKKLLQSVGQGLLNAENEAYSVADERMPDDAGAFTADWERVLGLPFSGLENLSDFQRLGIIKAKLNRPRTCTPQFLIDVARTLGYQITISKFDLAGVESEYVGNGILLTGDGLDFNGTTSYMDTTILPDRDTRWSGKFYYDGTDTEWFCGSDQSNKAFTFGVTGGSFYAAFGDVDAGISVGSIPSGWCAFDFYNGVFKLNGTKILDVSTGYTAFATASSRPLFFGALNIGSPTDYGVMTLTESVITQGSTITTHLSNDAFVSGPNITVPDSTGTIDATAYNASLSALVSNGPADADNYLRLQINGSTATAIYFRAGTARAGDQLVEYGNDALENVIKYFAPAHAVINFNYS